MLKELTKADFEKIVRYTSTSWRGFFNEREIKEHVDEFYLSYKESKQKKYVNNTMQTLCENMAEDLDYYDYQDNLDCDNNLGEDVETMEKIIKDFMEIVM